MRSNGRPRLRAQSVMRSANTIGLDSWGEWLIPGLFVVWGGVLLLGLRFERRAG
jgi:hypothetical protein